MSQPLFAMARRGWLPGLLDMARLMPSYYRVAFLGAGLQSGILHHLGQRPRTVTELVADLHLDPSMADALASWLDLGVQLRELAVDEGCYRLRSRRAHRLVRPANDPLAAMAQELVQLNHRLVVEAPGRIASGRRLAIDDAPAELIARSSRLGEPWMEAAIRDFVPPSGALRLLEVGCGSAAHIRTACRCNPTLEVLGLELQEPAAQLARRNLATWGLDERVTVEVGDVRDRPGTAEADLLTMHQNIYYFTTDEQQALFGHLGGFLVPGGRILVTTVVRGGGLATSALDLWGALTAGTERLPVPDRLVATMAAAGFTDVEARPLGRDRMYWAFTATWPGAGSTSA